MLMQTWRESVSGGVGNVVSNWKQLLSDHSDGPLTQSFARKIALIEPRALSRSSRVDPQSGPTQSGIEGFFHYNAQWIVAEQGCIEGLAKSNYINRVGEFANARNRHPPVRDKGRSSPEAGLATSDYINRTEGASDDELGASILITRGLPVHTGAGLARLLDARERKPDRTYRQYGGRMPRVGTHYILSFRYGISAEAAAAAAWKHAHMLSDRLKVPLEGRIHNENGAPDHVHLIIGTRVVEKGKLGRKCRELDAVSEKREGKRYLDGNRELGPTMEWLRADWARRMREASGDLSIDHRSYTRRGMPIYPVTHVARSEIEYQRRRGRADWRRERRGELLVRAAVLEAVAADQGQDPRHGLAPTGATAEPLRNAAPPIGGTLDVTTGVPEWALEQVPGVAEPLDPPVVLPVAAAELDLLTEGHVVDGLRRAEACLNAEATSLSQQGRPPPFNVVLNDPDLDPASPTSGESDGQRWAGIETAEAAVASPAPGDAAARATSGLDPVSTGIPSRARLHEQAPVSSGQAINDGNAPQRRRLRDDVLRRIAAHVGALAPPRPEPRSSPFGMLLNSIGLDPVAAGTIESFLVRARSTPGQNRQDVRAEHVPSSDPTNPEGQQNAGAEPPTPAAADLTPGAAPMLATGVRSGASLSPETRAASPDHDPTGPGRQVRDPDFLHDEARAARRRGLEALLGAPARRRPEPARPPASHTLPNVVARDPVGTGSAEPTAPGARAVPGPNGRHLEAEHPSGSAHGGSPRQRTIGIEPTKAATGDAPGTSRVRETAGMKPASSAAEVRRRFAVAACIDLARRHRLTTARERALAEVAGINAVELRRAAESEATKGEGAGGLEGSLQPQVWPPDLVRLLSIWGEEDRAARGERRRKQRQDQEGGSAAHAAISSPRTPKAAPQPADERAPDGPASHAAPEFAAPPRNGEPRPERDPAAPPAPAADVGAGPSAIAGSEVHACALYDAHAEDIIARAYDADRPPPSDDYLLRQVALRLRASGLDRDEVGRALLAGRQAGERNGSAPAVDRAVEAAFAERSTAWLAANPSFAAHAARVSDRAEMALWRRLRTGALRQLERDLDDAWVTRRTRADEIMARHRRTMAWITDLRWQNRRLQRRGLIFAVLSAAVEIGVLWPLAALEKRNAARERQEVHAAATAATARLKALREAWRAGPGPARAPSPVSDKPSELTGAAAAAPPASDLATDAVRQPAEAVPEAALLRPALPALSTSAAPSQPVGRDEGASGAFEALATAGLLSEVGHAAPREGLGGAGERAAVLCCVVLRAYRRWSLLRERQLADCVGIEPEAFRRMFMAEWTVRFGEHATAKAVRGKRSEISGEARTLRKSAASEDLRTLWERIQKEIETDNADIDRQKAEKSREKGSKAHRK